MGTETLSQSGASCSISPMRPGNSGGRAPPSGDEVLRWILWDNHKFSAQVGTCRFLMNFLPRTSALRA
jgi:glutathione S-transferase